MLRYLNPNARGSAVITFISKITGASDTRNLIKLPDRFACSLHCSETDTSLSVCANVPVIRASLYRLFFFRIPVGYMPKTPIRNANITRLPVLI